MFNQSRISVYFMTWSQFRIFFTVIGGCLVFISFATCISPPPHLSLSLSLSLSRSLSLFLSLSLILCLSLIIALEVKLHCGELANQYILWAVSQQLYNMQDSVEYLGWNVLRKYFINIYIMFIITLNIICIFKSLIYSRKTLHHRCLIRF